MWTVDLLDPSTTFNTIINASVVKSISLAAGTHILGREHLSITDKYDCCESTRIDS